MTRVFAPSMAMFLFVLATLSPPAIGATDASIPILASGASDAPGSASIHFMSRGGTIALDVSGRGTGAAGGGLLIAGPLGSVLVTVAKLPNRDGLLVDVHGRAQVHIDMTAAIATEGTFAKSIVFDDAPAGRYDLIAFGAGTLDAWRWSARAADATVVRQASNDVAWLATSHDFSGEANIQAFQAGAGARATDGSFGLHAVEGLVGVYYPIHATSVHDRLMATTPSGPRECTCAWMGPSARGGYVLHESGVGAGLEILADVLFIGADASFA